MARLEGVSDREAGWLVRLVYRIARRRVGHVPGPVRVLAHSPVAMNAAGAFEMISERARRVDRKLTSLAQIKAGSMIGCPF